MPQTTCDFSDVNDFDAQDASSAAMQEVSMESAVALNADPHGEEDFSFGLRADASQEDNTEQELDAVPVAASQTTATAATAAEAPAPVQPIDIVQLYTAHRSHLLRFVQRYVGNHEDAEDVVQNTFIEAVKCAHRFSGLSKPSTWLFGIALNLARNQVRRNIADRYETVDDNFMEQLIDHHADPAMLFELRQIAEKVDGMLRELPPKIRNTFEAVLDGDATYEEAAEHLQIPIGTVRSRVSRVRAAVRNEYGNASRRN